ncbi:carbohydrate ABC transporter permease [Kineosporia rhizophila]|uniref:carbohydrate ABC transporter permease n=1 Tax=Kineosporia TaxID=49184 RepID=UPI000AFFF7D1|nr:MULTISPECIES: carbohydrate ABC transporter permease [Kineosporia]MCE0534792.1 carbohydrate ABC transporter permease [Kineosporia rhizophila]GLY19281.1 sugar ABC transporter permease [Kineosporia sp. NBRC 101677]
MSTATLSRRSQNRETSQADKLGSKTFNRLAATCLTLWALIWLVPFAFTVITSFRPAAEITADPISIWSDNWTLDAYTAAFELNSIGWWYLNSFLISTLSVVFTVIVCSLIGFGLAHLRFRAKSVLAVVILAGLMVPMEALVLPQFIEFRALGLLGTYWALILPATASPVAVFVFRSFFKGIPEQLIEAARIDGASWWRVYWQICLPLTRPAISAVAIFTFVTTWNAFLWPLLVLTQTKSQTIPVGLSGLLGATGVNQAEVLASAVLGLLPLLAVFLVAQRQITQGIASTGIK